MSEDNGGPKEFEDYLTGDSENYNLSVDGVAILHPQGSIVVSIVNGSLCVNPLEGPYDSGNYGPYTTQVIDSLAHPHIKGCTYNAETGKYELVDP